MRMVSLKSCCLPNLNMLPIFGARQYQRPPATCFAGFDAFRSFVLRMLGEKFSYLKCSRVIVMGPQRGVRQCLGTLPKYTCK